MALFNVTYEIVTHESALAEATRKLLAKRVSEARLIRRYGPDISPGLYIGVARQTPTYIAQRHSAWS